MDFFEAQDGARKRTRLLVALFAAAVLAIIVAIYLPVHFMAGLGAERLVHPGLFLGVAGVVLTIVACGSTYRTVQLRRGGPAVAELLGGRRVAPDTADPGERRLINVVEEMAIASGTPVPAIYVLDAERGINAFAAGHTLHDAAVAVTRGALDHLSRDELQGVIAHEFSHILNGDMRLNIRIMGLLFGILLLTVIGRELLRFSSNGGSRRRKKGDGAQLALVGLVLIVVGYIGVFFGRLIQAAISRQREYLADAAAVQFTRNPHGIAGALKKIGGAAAGSSLVAAHALEASHQLFASHARRSRAALLSTHPPLVDRIRRIDPSFDGRFEPLPAAAPPERWPGAAHPVRDVAAAPGPIGAASLLSSVGAPTADHVEYAARLMESLPGDLEAAARSPEGAPALLFALLLCAPGRGADGTVGGGVAAGGVGSGSVAAGGGGSESMATGGVPGHAESTGGILAAAVDDAMAGPAGGNVDADSAAFPAMLASLLPARVRAMFPALLPPRSLEAIHGFGGEPVLVRTFALLQRLQAESAATRLLLLELALPTLGTLPADRVSALLPAVRALIRADGRIDFFEYAVYHGLLRQFDTSPSRAVAETVHSLPPLRAELEVVLTAVARAGAARADAGAAAFAAAAATLPGTVGPLHLRGEADTSLVAVDRALGRLRAGSPGIRRRVLEACAAAVTADGVVQPGEAELLRAIAAALDCPIPPLLPRPVPA